MSIKERIKQLQEAQRTPPAVLSEGVKETLRKSSLDDILAELAENFPSTTTEKRIEEGGEKQLIIITWPTGNKDLVNQMLISVRKNIIGFIGNQSDQYVRLTGEEISDRELLENCLAQTFVNPAKVSPTR